MDPCDGHTANCWASYEAAWRREQLQADREEWEDAMRKVSEWRDDWESFLERFADEAGKVRAFISALDGWLQEHDEYRQWFAGVHTCPQEPALPGHNTPVFPEDEPVDPSAEIPY